jgi:Domain of unknown function (DUF4332)
MDTMVAILRAAHCKSTHHYFAIDSLWEVATPRGMELANLLLAHHADYLRGAKDPDTVFKDFENHVVHVANGYWGGAAKTGEKWLERVYRLLSSAKWKEAAYAIGVLSHYFTDPFMPLHTAQSPRETVIHRPLEWSVCCAYQEIYHVCCTDAQLEMFELPDGKDWLTDSIHYGATYAHKYYELLLNDYNMNEASRFPKLALGTESKTVLAQLFVAVHTAWGSALDRIALESTIAIPKTSLTLPAILAGVQIPTKKIIQAMESHERRTEVQSILDEYLKTGKVVRNLSVEQKTVQAVCRQKPELRPPANEIERIEVKAQSPVFLTPIVETATPNPNPLKSVATPIASENATPETISSSPRPLVVPVPIASEQKSDATLIRKVERTLPETQVSESKATSKGKQVTLMSPIVDAPAIGPKTAARFQAIGCNTIEDFLSRDCEAIAQELRTSWINARLVSQWQQQSLLVCQIDRLTALGSGLLVLAGIDSAFTMASQNAIELHGRLVSLSQTNEGKRLLRDQDPPPIKTVERWIASAASVSASSVSKELRPSIA